MEAVKIILLCIASAILYGTLHDNVTARVCVEYFTIGHSPVFNTKSPTLLALGWGVIATWWAGLIVGIPAAVVSRVGAWPKHKARDLIWPITYLLIAMACLSLIAGWIGYFQAVDNPGLRAIVPSRVPTEKQAAFVADAFAHLAAYAGGFFGGLGVCGWLLRKRSKMASRPHDTIIPSGANGL